ncbi:MAG: glutamine-hydrolyzing GMP synthase [Sphingobacteriales bacterium]|nr:glutamine-hydrolyzing GMP synthase [Sphingobacteriales bacterium]
MSHQLILVLDFGAQYRQLIARRVREANVYCEVLPHDTPAQKIAALKPAGIIFTGGPSVVYQANAPVVDKQIYQLGIPILGICYGAQLMAHDLGGQVEKAPHREYGKKDIVLNQQSLLFNGLPSQTTCWMSHTYHVATLPEGFTASAHTNTCPIGAMEHPGKKMYAVQFHPEVAHTPDGTAILQNFLYKVCGCSPDWTMGNYVTEQVQALQQRIGARKVLCALSGGVDSSVAAALVHKAIGNQLTCLFVDHGLLRKNEADEVEALFSGKFHFNFIRIDASERFLSALKGITDPEQKRKIIGEQFIRVFEDEAKKLGEIELLVQGTIYPDIIESGTAHAAVIKSHHNVGGLPENMDFTAVIEPLDHLFKDEVRQMGKVLGLPDWLIMRQPFPGPGLAIRIIGEITAQKLSVLREADAIYRAEIAAAGWDKHIWQYFAVYTGLHSVGVMGDERTYDTCIALRAVTSTDGMTADWAHIPYDLLAKISNRIVNEVPHVNRVVYDITSKPPGTIEWE